MNAHADIPADRIHRLDQAHALGDAWLTSVVEHFVEQGMADVDASVRAPGIFAGLTRLDYDHDTLQGLLTAALVRLCEHDPTDLEGIDPS